MTDSTMSTEQGLLELGFGGPPNSRSATAKTRFAGSDLVPNLADHKHAILTRYWYWVGVLPQCPVEYIMIAGTCFPKINAEVVPDPMRTGSKKQVPVIGSLVRLTESRIRLLRKRLPFTVLRFTGSKGIKEEPGTGQNLKDLHVRPQPGHVITIPTPERVQWARDNGKPTREYIPHESDEPAARYMFAVLCENQQRPERGSFYPDVLENSGLVWPDELDLLE